MTLLGGAIKTAIDFNGLITREPNPYKAQKMVLLQLLKKARHTAFGLKYKFNQILESKNPVAAFQENIPVYDYDVMYEEW